MEQVRYAQIIDKWNSFDVILAPSFAAAASLNKAAAAHAAAGAFGVVACTFNEWIEKLWEQEGDGRTLISEPVSQLVFQSLIEENPSTGGALAQTRNLAIAVARCVRMGSGVAAFEEAVASDSAKEPLSAAEKALLELIAAYRARIEQLGFIDAGAAAAWVAAHGSECIAAGTRVCYVSDAPLAALHQELLSALEGTISFCHLCEDGSSYEPRSLSVKPFSGQRELRFALAEGPYAQPQLVDAVLKAGEKGPVVITCTRPLDLWEPLQSVFDAHGLTAGVKGRRPVLQCDVGTIFLAAAETLEPYSGPDYLLPLTDVLNVDALGVWQPAVWQLQAHIRADRLIDKNAVIDRMVELSPLFGAFVQLVTRPSARVIARIEEMLRKKPGLAIEFEPIAAYFGAALELGIAPERACKLILPLLEAAQVGVSLANYAAEVGELPQVRVLTQAQTAALEPGECETLMLLELNNANYPAARRKTTVSTLLAKLGVVEAESYIDRQRRIMNALAELPARTLVLSRPLKDHDSKTQYPCAMYEEFLLANGGLVEPEPGSDGCISAGEEHISADVLGLAPNVGERELRGREDSALASQKIAGTLKKGSAGLVASPSNLEVYHECPRKWFLMRWLNTGDPTEGFDALGRGTFIHDCIASFYQRFIKMGHAKVTRDNMDAARELMGRVVDEMVEEHKRREAGGFQGRYVALPGLLPEEHEFERIKRDLIEVWLKEEERFLAGTGFMPTLFEYSIDALGAEVGGVRIRGRVDRIDMDEAGNLVVVDYKGGLGREHDGYLPLPSEGPATAIFDGKKIQTYIYAAALAQAGRLEVPDSVTDEQRKRIEAFTGSVAACAYFSYKGRLSGTDKRTGAVYAPGVLGAEGLLVTGGKTERELFSPNALTGELGFFELVGQLVEQVASEQAQGVIEARLPAEGGRAICRYCPDATCAKREV